MKDKTNQAKEATPRADVIDYKLGDEPKAAPAKSVPAADVHAVVDLTVRKVLDKIDATAAPATVDSGAGATITQRYVPLGEQFTAKTEDAGVRVTVTVSSL